MMWWNNLKQYCEEFIALHYTSDELVKGDSELQNMVDEVRHVGVGGGSLLLYASYIVVIHAKHGHTNCKV